MATEKAGLLDQAERQGNGNVPPPPYSDEQGASAPSSQQTTSQPSPSTGNTYQYYGGVTQHPSDPHHTTVIVTGPQPPVCYLPPAPVLSKYPVGMECPSCHQQVMTKTENVNGQLFWVSVLFLCVFGFWLALCFVPCCVKSVKDVRHSCPQCKAVLGTFQRLR
ncbi:lipopolysaccharide-induced tumor necrosis factor-alpha factor homolog [Branchiostoma lanceolatum]|uniref:lipopolysaccharide-induced tumor necrosis factor-alpha factor homolog n=1 Tax=Branchiostoma lanceolatum TaxID=7740 RepID=UPI003455A224